MEKTKLTKKQRVLKRLGALILSGALLVSPLSACGRKMDCPFEGENHAHKYVNDNGFIMYKESEYEFQEGFTWTSEVVDNTREVKLLDDHNILKIEDNKKLLENLISNNTPFIEYEYTYTWWMAIPHYHSNGDYTYVTYTYIPMTSEDFTTDPNHSNLTGRIREANYKYYGYTIVTDENGKSKAVRSQLLDNLLDVKSECPYFSLSDYTQIIYGEPYHVMTRNFRQ